MRDCIFDVGKEEAGVFVKCSSSVFWKVTVRHKMKGKLAALALILLLFSCDASRANANNIASRRMFIR